MQTLFRHAAWDDPWWVNENRNAGRYNYAGRDSTQYLCLHPLGVSAEFLRHLGPASSDDIEGMRLRLWAMQLDLTGFLEITFDNATEFGLTPQGLVGDDYSATQKFSQSLRDQNVAGFVAPSAALPGTRIAVLLGPRLVTGWQHPPLDPQQVQTAHTIDGPPAIEVLPYVRWFGQPHRALEEWLRAGAFDAFEEPAVPR